MSTLGVENVASLLRRLGVRPSDCVFVHSDLKRMGLARDADGQPVLALSPPTLYQALSQVLGRSGTIAVPAFSNSWGKGEDFDVDHSPATTGAFSEYVRTRPGALRTSHPLLSVAAVGAGAAEVTDADDTAFGPGSPYGRLHAMDAVMLMVGVPYCSFKDYVETIRDVPYRYPKRFYGRLVRGGMVAESSCRHFVRYRCREGTTPLRSLLQGLPPEIAGALPTADLGCGRITAVRARDLFRFVGGLLAADPYHFVAEASCGREAMDFLARARQWRSPCGWSLTAEALQTHKGELWQWRLRHAPPELCRHLGITGPHVTLAVGAGNFSGAEVALDACSDIGPACDESITVFLGRMAVHPGTEITAAPGECA